MPYTFVGASVRNFDLDICCEVSSQVTIHTIKDHLPHILIKDFFGVSVILLVRVELVGIDDVVKWVLEAAGDEVPGFWRRGAVRKG